MEFLVHLLIRVGTVIRSGSTCPLAHGPRGDGTSGDESVVIKLNKGLFFAEKMSNLCAERGEKTLG